jgi:hypothetical protein
MYHRLRAVHHEAKADAYASARMHTKATGHRARADLHRHRLRFGADTPLAAWLEEELVDVITLDVFVDPVVISTGHTYGREGITQFREQGINGLRCPNSRRPFSGEFVPNLLVTDLTRMLARLHLHTELENAKKLATMLSDPDTKELFIYPVVSTGETLGLTFERAAAARQNEGPLVLVANHKVKTVVGRFVSAYAHREGVEWTAIRAACATYERRKREADRAPEYESAPIVNNAEDLAALLGDGELSDDDAVRYLLQMAHDVDRYDETDGFTDVFVRRNLLDRGTTTRHLDLRYDAWRESGQ